MVRLVLQTDKRLCLEESACTDDLPFAQVPMRYLLQGGLEQHDITEEHMWYGTCFKHFLCMSIVHSSVHKAHLTKSRASASSKKCTCVEGNDRQTALEPEVQCICMLGHCQSLHKSGAAASMPLASLPSLQYVAGQ